MKSFSTDVKYYHWMYKQSYLYLQYGKFDQAIILLKTINALLINEKKPNDKQLNEKQSKEKNARGNQINDQQVLKMLCYALTQQKRFHEALACLDTLVSKTEFRPDSWPQYYLLYSQVLYATGAKSRAQAMLQHYQQHEQQHEQKNDQQHAQQHKQSPAKPV